MSPQQNGGGGERAANARRVLENMTSSLLALPVLFTVLAVLLAALLLSVEPEADPEVVGFLFPGSADSARAILGAIIASTITLAGLVFSITMLVLQLASSQYSPRTLRTFLADRNSHFTLAMFVGTFTYSVVVLRAIGPEGEEAVPGMAVTVSLLLMLVTIGVFVQYIAHITGQIRAASIMRSIAQQTEKAITKFEDDTDEPPEHDAAATPMRTVRSEGCGYVVLIEIRRLVELAAERSAIVEVVPRVGDFVVSDAPLLRVFGVAEDADEELRGSVRLHFEREPREDIAFGLRQLVDIAVRALSPSMNDPTTAMESMNHLHELLRRLARAELSTGAHCDNDSELRVIQHVATWREHFCAVVDPLLDHGGDDPEIVDALEAMLLDLLDQVDGENWSEALGALHRVRAMRPPRVLEIDRPHV
jgi:uncharacterized membrane protein